MGKIIFDLTAIHPCYQIKDCTNCPFINSNIGCISACYLEEEEKFNLTKTKEKPEDINKCRN